MTNLRILPGAGLSALCVLCTATALAERVTVTINGLEEDMLEELTKEIHAVVEDRRNGIFDEPEEHSNAYKPMIKLQAVS